MSDQESAATRRAWNPRIAANHRLLDALAALWDAFPDQRFGQLVMNVSRDPGGFADTWEWKHGEWLVRIGDVAQQWTDASASACAPSRFRARVSRSPQRRTNDRHG